MSDEKFAERTARGQEENGYDAERGTWLDLEGGELVDTPRELLDQIAAADEAMMLSAETSSDEDAAMRGSSDETLEQEEGGDRSAEARRLSQLPLASQRLLRHCRRHYNTIFGQQAGAARLQEPDPGQECWSSSDQDEMDDEVHVPEASSCRPTAWSRFTWQDFGISSKATAAGRSWARTVRQLMHAGSVQPDRRYKMRFPQDDTALDGVDLAVQLRLLRRYGDYEMLSSGALPGGRIARWLQRLHWPRPPKVVGVWFNMSAGKWPLPQVHRRRYLASRETGV